MMSQADRLQKLIELAEIQLSFSITEDSPEYVLLHKVVEGEEADYSGNFPENPDDESISPNDKTPLSASLIIWLCTNPKATEYFTHRGLRIVGAKIEGFLDLQFASLDYPLVFHKCVFTDVISLQQTKVKSLDFSGSYLASGQISSISNQSTAVSLDARNIQIEGSILLRDEFTVTGAVLLSGATIGGSLVCKKGVFDNPEGKVLDAQSADIKGNVLLSNEFKAIGKVLLLGATIGGSLQCNNGVFNNPKGDALNAQGAEIKDNVFLSDGFTATGKVSLVGSTIGGSLVCQKGVFDNPEGYALDAQGAEIKGFILLRDEFKAIGVVSLSGATIGGGLVCKKGVFDNPKGKALEVESVEIKGPILLSEGFTATGKVSLLGASIGGALQCNNGIFDNPEGDALDAQSADIKGNVLLSDKFTATGRVLLLGATIGGSLQCNNGGVFDNPEGYALDVQGAEIKGNVLLRDGFTATGKVSLLGATIGENLTCEKGVFNNPEGDVLIAENAEIKGNVLLHDGFKATGKVSLVGATIGGSLICKNGVFDNPGKVALTAESAEIKGNVVLGTGFKLSGDIRFVNVIIDGAFILKGVNDPQEFMLDLSFAKITILSDQQNSWPEKGDLFLEGLIYEKIGTYSPTDSKSRLKWLRLQSNHTFSFQPYEQLAQVLRVSGHQQAATEILINKQKDNRRYGDLKGLRWFWNWFIGFTIAYGYKSHQALLFSVVMIIVGWPIFQHGYSAGIIRPSALEEFQIAEESSSQTYPKFVALIYSLDVFLPIIDLHQESYWIPKPPENKEPFKIPTISVSASKKDWIVKSTESEEYFEIPITNLEKSLSVYFWIQIVYFWIHIITGWVATSLWVAGFTGLVRRIE